MKISEEPLVQALAVAPSLAVAPTALVTPFHLACIDQILTLNNDLPALPERDVEDDDIDVHRIVPLLTQPPPDVKKTMRKAMPCRMTMEIGFCLYRAPSTWGC